MAANCLRQYSSSSSGSPKIVARRPKKENGQNDEFSQYRHLCEVRMRRLERYKKAKSFCSLEDEAASSAGSSGLSSLGSTISSTTDSIPTSHSHSNSLSDSLPMTPITPTTPKLPEGNQRPASQVSSANSVVESQFEVLREKMISLMENDVQLLQKLLKLGETIQELRNSRPIQRASSETSLSSSLGEEEDDWRPLEQRENNFSASMSAITRLYVDDEPPAENVQYFSRKNSVLRIPIPPRSSNRMLGNKIPRRPSEMIRQSRLHLEDSGHSSGSSSDSPPQHSPTATSDSLSSRSTLSGRLSSPIFEEIKIPRVSAGHRVSLPVGHVPEKPRYVKYGRNESSDSGIRADDGSKSPPLVP